MWRWIVFLAAIGVIVVIGFSMVENTGGSIQASAVVIEANASTEGFARATTPLDWEFPRNFGPHTDYQTEWWYYTGNFATADDRQFGFQFTVFRRGIVPPVTGDAQVGEGEWRSNDLYMAHFAVTDVAGNRFFHEERFSREGANLAGATVDPAYRVWLEDWQVVALNDDATLTRITAQMQPAINNGVTVGIDFTLDQLRPPALQGDMGLSQKSGEVGNASHYYSLTRLATTGTIRIGDETFDITGYAWKDHEFGTSALGANALGWDWFGLHFDDDRELMVGQIRLTDGGRDPYFGGLMVFPDGTFRYLPAESFTITHTGTWQSPHTGAVYPAGWTITLAGEAIGEADDLTFTATPQIADQELHGGGIAYYEGSVRIEGDVTGFGYVELTGYADSMTGRF